MTEFRPFCGTLYDDPSPDAGDGVIDLSSVVQPIDGSDPSIDAPAAPMSIEGPSRYHASRLLDEASAPRLLDQWATDGVLSTETEPALYLYRAGRHMPDGSLLQGSGVIGLGAASGNALDELRPTLLPIDELEFSELLVPVGTPLARATDPATETHYRLWPIRQYGVIDLICTAVAATGRSAPGLVAASADGVMPPIGFVFSLRGHMAKDRSTDATVQRGTS